MSTMISARQIRAARGLLEISSKELAEKVGITQATLSKIETEQVQPQERTLRSIAETLDMQGVEFLDGDGVKMRQQEVRVFSGKDGYRQFLDHIYATLKNGGRIRQVFLNERSSLSFQDEIGKAHIDRMAALENIDAKVLTGEGDWAFPASYVEYRWINKEDRDLAPYYMYGDNLVLPMNESAHRQEWISVRSKLLADRFSKQFDAAWAKASTPKKAKGSK
ncbi:MAG: helix-turn-helix domain-containing protein [Bdellovibrionales bacterium]